MKTWNKEEIRNLLIESDKAVERGILAIFDKQTNDEQRVGDTRHVNNVGFSGAHANPGSYYAKWILSGKKLNGPFLGKSRKLILHYTRQLAEIATEKEARKALANSTKIHECASPGCYQDKTTINAYCRDCNAAWENNKQNQAFDERNMMPKGW